MSSSAVNTLEKLPNELQFGILKYLSFYDRIRAFAGLNSRFNQILKDPTLGIEKTNIEEDIKEFCELEDAKPSRYVSMPIIYESSRRCEWEFGHESLAQYLHSSVAAICSKHAVTLNKYFFSTSLDEERLRKAEEEAERDMSDNDHLWPRWHRKYSQLEA